MVVFDKLFCVFYKLGNRAERFIGNLRLVKNGRIYSNPNRVGESQNLSVGAVAYRNLNVNVHFIAKMQIVYGNKYTSRFADFALYFACNQLFCNALND